jgi:prepilin-type N-terminal cleavage/methylation domain-containing protein
LTDRLAILEQAKNKGFTLLELVVTIGVISVGILSVVTVFANTTTINRQARNLALATEAAQQKLEAYRNLTYASIPGNEDFTSSLPSALLPPRSAIANFYDLSPAVDGLRRLDISITYTEKGVLRKAHISTLISRQGINR